MPFRIVACTFPDNFSRNSCIKDIRRPNRKEERQSLTPTSFSSTCPTTHTSPTQINLLTLLHWLKNAKLICHTDTTQIFNDIQSLFSSIKPGTPFCLFLVSLLPFVIRFLSVSYSTPFWSCPLNVQEKVFKGCNCLHFLPTSCFCFPNTQNLPSRVFFTIVHAIKPFFNVIVKDNIRSLL